jgi:hypothetical protein
VIRRNEVPYDGYRHAPESDEPIAAPPPPQKRRNTKDTTVNVDEIPF